MEGSQADYLLSPDDDDNRMMRTFDWPVRFVLSKLVGIKYSDGKKVPKLVRATERKSLYSARYLRYTVVMFCLYVFLGIGFYSGSVGYTVLDSIYFIVVSFYTVGFGDYVPASENQRFFTTFYIVVGFALLCVICVTAGDFFHNAIKLHNSVRTQRVLDVITQEKLNMNASDEDRKEYRDSSGSGSGRKVCSRRLSMMNKDSKGDIFPSPYSIPDPRAIELMRKVNMDMFDEELEAIKLRTRKDFLVILFILFLGTLCMGLIEDWSAADALYWACVTITTIGYGDVAPETKAGKAFTIAYCLFGIGIMAKAVTDLASYPFLMREKKTELQVLMQFGTDLSEEQLTIIQNNELINAVPKLRKAKDRVEKSEFVLILLQLMDKVQDTDIVYISEIFDALDKSGEGHLSESALVREMEHARSRAATAVMINKLDSEPTTTRSSVQEVAESLLKMFGSSNSQSRPSTSYATVQTTRVPFSTAPTEVNGYQPPVHGGSVAAAHDIEDASASHSLSSNNDSNAY